jgi:hypothetical protein
MTPDGGAWIFVIMFLIFGIMVAITGIAEWWLKRR